MNLRKNVFMFTLKVLTDVDALTKSGKEFQAAGPTPATEKERSPNCVFDLGATM
jgi:hypothetical protein